MSHNRTHPQVGEQVQITIGLDKGKRFIVIRAYLSSLELGDENGKFIRFASVDDCIVCPLPAANTNGESLAALAGGGQGEGSGVLFFCFVAPHGLWHFRSSGTSRRACVSVLLSRSERRA